MMMKNYEMSILNMWLAEHVMQWIHHPTTEEFDDMRRRYGGIPAIIGDYRTKEGKRICQDKDWQPTTNIEQAMMVADALADHIQIDIFVLGRSIPKYTVKAYSVCYDDVYCKAAMKLDELPLAICLAAKAAKSAGVNDE